MLILPERGIVNTKFLLAVPNREWMPSSQAEAKDEFGHRNGLTRFYAEQRAHDGHVVWRGWFEDRADFDAFLWAVASETLPLDRHVQRLPTPEWNPAFWELPFLWASTRSLTTTNAANQTDTVPSDWNSANNFIDVIAPGGSGGATGSNFNCAVGGSGGAWSRQTNVTLTQGGSATYRLPAGVTGASAGLGANVNGTAGADAWYNGATLGAASVGAKAGLGGTAGTSVQASVAGGAAASGVGSSKKSGGAAGSATSSLAQSASGGGGAATSAADGVASANSNNSATAGGASGSGAAGGNNTGGTGTAGNEYGGGLGGGGGGGARIGATPAGPGGTYGAGGGAASHTNACVGGASTQALIFQNWTPALAFAPFRRSTRFFTRKF